MSLVSKIINFDNPVFTGYITYGSVLVLKMMLMAPLTARLRMKLGIPRSPEDHKYMKRKPFLKDHEDVDRVRRAHMNDLENILMFYAAGLFYILTDPNPAVALNLFRAYTLARCIHTFVYAIVVVPQPARAYSWLTGFLITGYMAIQAICHFSRF